VTVTRADGSPAAGATVEVQVQGSFGQPPPAPPAPATKTSDASGTAAFDFGPRVADVACRLVAWSGDDAATDVVWATFDAWTQAVLRLAPGLVARGRVLDDEGRPVAAAVVTLQATHPEMSTESRIVGARVAATTALDGSFTLPALPSSEMLHAVTNIDVAATGFDPSSAQDLRWKRADDVAKPLEFRLVPSVHVRGRCVNAGGASLADVRVELVQTSTTTSARSGSDGRFDLPGLRREGGAFVASSPLFAATRVAAISGRAADVDLGDVVLREGGVVRGVVVDGAGSPVIGASLTLWRATSVAGGGYTDADGRFVLEHVGDGDHEVVVSERDPPRWLTPVMAKIEGVRAGGAELRVVLDSGRLLRLQFTDDATKEPVVVHSVKAQWRASGSRDSPEARTFDASARSPGWKAIRIELSSAGHYDVDVDVPGFETAKLSAIDVSADRESIVDVPLRRAR